MLDQTLRPSVLFRDAGHVCLCFRESDQTSVESNQYVIVHAEHAAILDPGGDLSFKGLLQALGEHIDMSKLDYILASHQDPDVIASLPRWLLHSSAQVVIPALWERFLPHLVSDMISDHLKVHLAERLVALPDAGGRIHLAGAQILVLPAHFLHSPGNFSYYDTHARVLFSGDIGSATNVRDLHDVVEDFQAHEPALRAFHQRYMSSNSVARRWIAMIRQLDVQIIAPQHGPSFVGPTMVEQFLSWLETLPMGVDRIDELPYEIPPLSTEEAIEDTQAKTSAQ